MERDRGWMCLAKGKGRERERERGREREAIQVFEATSACVRQSCYDSTFD